MKRTVIATLAILLSACSSGGGSYHQGPYGSAQQQSVSAANVEQGQTVNWGGKIIQVNNYQTHSLLQLVQLPLDRYSRPIESADSLGRFYVRSDDFLDPEIFKVDSYLTVSGQVAESTMLMVDEKQLELPVIHLKESQRWPQNHASGRPYNPKHNWPFVGYGYYGTGSYSP